MRSSRTEYQREYQRWQREHNPEYVERRRTADRARKQQRYDNEAGFRDKHKWQVRRAYHLKKYGMDIGEFNG